MSTNTNISIFVDHASISFFDSETGLESKVSLAADDLLPLIQNLGKTRATLSKVPTPSISDADMVAAAKNTQIHVSSALIGDCITVSFNHPGYGPTGFIIDRKKALKLARDLIAETEKDLNKSNGIS